MFKRIFCLLLTLALLSAAGVSAVTDAETVTVFFEADFDDNELPGKTDVTFGDDGYIYADDKMMIFEASDTYPPVTTVLFPYKTGDGGFLYECDVKVESHLSGGSWFALCFGAVNEDYLYQFTLRCGGGSDGVAMMYKKGGSSWKNLESVSVDELIAKGAADPGKFIDGQIADDAEFHLSVAVNGGAAYGYIDGALVIECRAENGAKGLVGLNGRGVSLAADNVKISDQIPPEARSAASFGASLYEPDSGVLRLPLIIERDKNGLKEYTEEDKRPGALMMTVKPSGGVLHCYDGATDLGTLEERIGSLGGLMLPVLYVTDAQSAEMLASYVTDSEVKDAFVVFSRSSFSEQFRENGYIRSVMDLSSRDMIDVAETYNVLYSNGLRIVMLSEKAADPETVAELHKRLISVWVVSPSGALNGLEAAVNGADAVITPDPIGLIGVFESMKELTLLGPEVVISDGGDTSAAPADTLKSAAAAADAGFSVIRISVRLTKDGVPVLSRTDTTVDMSSELVISEYPLSALQSLTYNDQRMSRTDRMTSLEELFDRFSRDYPDTVFHVCVSDRGAADAVCDTAALYDMKERCVIVSDVPSVLDAAAGRGAAAAYSGGPYVWDGRDKESALSSVCRVLVGYDSVYYGSSAGVTDERSAPLTTPELFPGTTDIP